MMTNTITLSDQQVADYHEDGYLIIRNVLSIDEIAEFRQYVQQQVETNAYPPSLKYPTPGKYTISGNQMAEPGLASVAEHPVVVDAVECLLGQPAHLTAYVVYVRTPGDRGSGAHCDYKRWRPVGSSMNWLFAIIPITDFDLEFGPFLVSPGSHKLASVIDPHSQVWDLNPPDANQLAAFIDPELKAGDLLLADQHTWHKAPAGTASRDRCGVFNKYCAANAPPAVGYYPYHPVALDALSDVGKRLLPVCFDQPITTTRLLVDRLSSQESRFLLLHNGEGNRWQLPGGQGWEEMGLVAWDIGSRVGSLQSLIETQLSVSTPWVSYIEDDEQEDGVCRIYGYTDHDHAFDGLKNNNGSRYGWFTREQLHQMLGESDPICRSIRTWQKEDIVRGKGKACHQSKRQFD